jgi:hypothetical protein
MRRDDHGVKPMTENALETAANVRPCGTLARHAFLWCGGSCAAATAGRIGISHRRETAPSRAAAAKLVSIVVNHQFAESASCKMTPISPMIQNSILNSIRASTAPTPAEGSVDRIVSGWI